jgi:GNAT superfamily N-acetyltransferase
VANLTIRPAIPSDAHRIHELHVASVHALCAPSYDQAVVDGWLKGRSAEGYLLGISGGAIFIAEAASEIVGFCEAVPGEVRAVFVEPQWVGKGVGRVLLSHALSLASSGHSGPVRLESTLNALTFYEHFGFRQIGRATVRRNDVDVPVVLMERPVR